MFQGASMEIQRHIKTVSFKRISRMFMHVHQVCLKCVSGVFHQLLSVFQGHSIDVSMGFQGYFQMCFKGALRGFCGWFIGF